METTITLDGRCMQTAETAHSYLRQQLRFPAYYGSNADALFDCLTEIGDPVTLVLSHPEKTAPLILAVIRTAVAQNPSLHLEEEEAYEA